MVLMPVTQERLREPGESCHQLGGHRARIRRFLSKKLPACLSFRPPAALRKGLHSPAMRPFARLAGRRKSCAVWYFFSANRLMTMTVNHWLAIFTRPERVEILLDSWCYLQANDDLRLHGHVVLENHLHLIGGSAQIGQDIQRFKS